MVSGASAGLKFVTLLFDVVVEDLEVCFGQTTDRIAAVVGDHDVDIDQIHVD